MANSFGSQSNLKVGDRTYTIHRLDAVYKIVPDAVRLPYSLKILLENLLRGENGLSVTADDVEALAKWDPIAEPSQIGRASCRERGGIWVGQDGVEKRRSRR